MPFTLAGDVADRIRANPTGGIAYMGAGRPTTIVLPPITTATSSRWRATTYFSGTCRQPNTLPNGTVTVNFDDTVTPPNYTIAVNWDEPGQAPLNYTISIPVNPF